MNHGEKMRNSDTLHNFDKIDEPVTDQIRRIETGIVLNSEQEKQLADKFNSFADLHLKKRKNIQKMIESAGFSCLRCGECCDRKEDENAVFILPAELEKIESAAGMNRNEFVMPLFPDFYDISENDESVFIRLSRFSEILNEIPDQIDEDGRIHTFGWMLRRLKNGACIFLEPETKKCKIYDHRPLLCRTYPFYFIGSEVEKCDCCGIGTAVKTEKQLATELTDAVCDRILNEQDDFLRTQQYLKIGSLNVKYNTKQGRMKALSNLNEGVLNFIVYDSSGIYETTIRLF